MSATLTLHPAHPQGQDLSDELKIALQNIYEDYYKGIEIGQDKIEFFRGLYAAGIKDADKVIKAIEKYGSVVLKWEY